MINIKVWQLMYCPLQALNCTAAPLDKDKKMLHRLELLEKIDEEDREPILKVVDNYLTTAKLQTPAKKLKKIIKHKVRRDAGL